MNAATLFLLPTFLTQGMRQHPHMELALAQLWLNPISNHYHDQTWDGGIDPQLREVFEIFKEHFPQWYDELLLRVLRGDKYEKIEGWACQQVNTLIRAEVEYIEHIAYGIPFLSYAYGDETNPEARYLVDVFERNTGVFDDLRDDDPDYDPDEGEEFDPADDPTFDPTAPNTLAALSAGQTVTEQQRNLIARAIALSLLHHRKKSHKDVGMAIKWIFHITGNTVADYTEEEIFEWGTEPMGWDKDSIDFMNNMQDEAEQFFNAAQHGIKYLQKHPALLKHLEWNIRLAVKEGIDDDSIFTWD